MLQDPYGAVGAENEGVHGLEGKESVDLETIRSLPFSIIDSCRCNSSDENSVIVAKI